VLKSLSNSSGNNVREKAILIINNLEGVYLKYAKHEKLAGILLNWIKPHMVNVIRHQIPEQELKQILVDCKNVIDGLDSQINLGQELKEARTINPPKHTKFVESIKENKEALELLP